MPETFTISDSQLKKMNRWFKKHRLEKPPGTISGQFSYCFTPTSLGVIVRVEDSISGKKLNVTDYMDW